MSAAVGLDRDGYSHLSSFLLGTFGYDSNAIAFQYSLANGKSGIAVATVPEPASLGMLAAAAVMALRRRRACRSRGEKETGTSFMSPFPRACPFSARALPTHATARRAV